jgi:tetratricopeptide (TPR) repeat protein
MWLGQLWEHEGKLAQALTAYRAISLTNTAADNSAIDATARLQAEIFEQNRAAGKLSDAAIADAVAYFENIVRGDRTSTDEPWSHAQRQAALHAARLRLQFTTDGFAQAQRLLEAALKAAGDASDEWKSQASSLLVVAQAGAGDRSAAQETLRRLFGGSTLRQLEMLRGLHEIGERSSPAVAREIAKLQLEVIDKLEAAASKLSADQRKGFELISAQALVADGQASTALKKLEQLSREYPDDGEVQRRYAMLLSMIEERPSQLAARTAWRNVLRRTPPDTPAWYEAKLALAQAQFALGEKQEAAQMIEVLQTLQPELGGPAIKAKFLNLLKRCRE